jgi:hypothetical protein
MGRVARRGAAAAVVAMMVMAGCGSGSSGPSQAELLDPTNSPIAKLLGYDISPADQKVKQLETEQAVADCMKDEGWEYKPQDYSSMGGNTAWEDEYAEQMADPVAYGEKYGYGIVRQNDLNNQMNEDGVNTYEDPNQDYLNSLSMEESQAYQEALYGKQSMEPMDDSEEYIPPPIEEQGCYGKANAEVYGAAMSDPDIQTKMNDFYENAENDPDLVAAGKVWATCMSEIDQSYEWKTPDDIWNDLYNRLQEAQGYTPTTYEDGSTGFDSPMDADGNYVEPEVDEGKIEQLRTDEIAIWADDFKCQGEAKILQVRRDVEQRLVDDLLEEFPELGGE